MTNASPADDATLTAALSGDELAFAALVERHRSELRVHCYRMLGSLEDAEDLVQETFLRAWRNLAGFVGRSTLRAWLYRIATNACLDALAGRARRFLPQQLSPPSDPSVDMPVRHDIAWLQPIPDRLVPSAPAEEQPDAMVIRRETIELAFVAALQLLGPTQRAVLILRDVLGWPSKQAATQLGISVAAVNSALHRARTTMREQSPGPRSDWTAPPSSTQEEREVVRRYVDAVERADLDAVAQLLARDVRTAMPPLQIWFEGRDTVLAALASSWDPALPGYVGRFRGIITGANLQPAVAGYTRGHGESEHTPFAIGLYSIDGGVITDIVAFHDPGLFAAFGLPPALPSR
jgi:RNA polymerase sigma-70 factor (ECF subfamily)